MFNSFSLSPEQAAFIKSALIPCTLPATHIYQYQDTYAHIDAQRRALAIVGRGIQHQAMPSSAELCVAQSQKDSGGQKPMRCSEGGSGAATGRSELKFELLGGTHDIEALPVEPRRCCRVNTPTSRMLSMTSTSWSL